jgi:hypothetical protein
MRWTIVAALWALAIATENAVSAPVSCSEAFEALMQMPELEVLDELDNGGARFAYKRGGGHNLTCAAAPDLVIGFSPLPGPEVWPLFGRLARAVGADPEEAIKAAQECRGSAEERRRRSGPGGLTEGEPIWTDTLHVDCRASKNFLSLGVFKRPQ